MSSVDTNPEASFVTPTASRADLLERTRAPALSNSWLWVLILVSAAIVLADGFTRKPNLDWELFAEEPLHYQPYAAASVFAFATLPLVFGFARRAGAGWAEGLLLWFLLATVVYTKDFAYLHVPGMSLYITDIVLALLLMAVCRQQGLSWVRPRSALTKSMSAFLAIGAVWFVRALLARRESLIAARDFALVVYSLFAFVAVYLVASWAAVRRLFLIFLVGSVLATVGALAWFVTEPGQRRYIFYGIYVLVGFLGVLLATVGRILRPFQGWLLAIALSIGILLYNSRAVYLALAASLSLAFVIGVASGRRLPLPRMKTVAALLAAIALAFVLVLQTDAGAKYAERTMDELVFGLFHYSDDPNAQFRILAWTEAITRFLEDPLMGEGFAIPFTFGSADTDPRPHNTFLTVLYKMGLMGFVPLVLFLVLFWGHGIRVLRSNRARESFYLYAVILALAAFCVYGFFGLVLESPFTASVFWILIGVGSRLMYSTPLLASRPRTLL